MSFDTRVIFDCLKAGIFSQKHCTGEKIFEKQIQSTFYYSKQNDM